MASTLNTLTLAQMQSGLAARHFSPAELLASHLDAIERHNPSLNAFTQLLPPLHSQSTGPLSGIPLSIKDSLDIAGYPTVCGLPSRLSAIPSANALCVDRLLAAGATILGKTNTPPYLMDWETNNNVYGPTHHPTDSALSPGGSSGGEASAIAACLSAGGIGSDGGGSIRLPAALCGICGLKPTPGRLPATGHFPRIAHPGGLFGVIGPMARTVADLRILFNVLAGHHDSDPFSIPFTPLPPPRQPRIGLLDHPSLHVALPHLPHPVEPFPPFPWDRAFDIWRFFFLRLNAHPIGEPTPHTAEFFSQPPPTAQEILEMLAARDALRARLLHLMDRFPFLLLPITLVPPWKIGAFPGPWCIQPLTIANLFGLPALALPPFLQVVAKPWHEESLLGLGATLFSSLKDLP